MAPPKKATKMDLNSFLNDDTFGSAWEETDVDLSKISIPVENVKANTIPLEELAATKGGASQNFKGGSRLDPALGGGRSYERTEYPVPDRPPYRAIINNIPWDITPEGVQAWVEDGLQKPGAVEEVDLPRSIKDPTRLKGIAFVTLKEREDLVQTLTFNATSLNDRTVYVSVAAPRRDGFDWGGARGSNYQASEPAADLDWGAARGSQFRGSRPPRNDPDLDWGAMRGSQFRGSKPPREEPELDWGAMRGSQFRGSKPAREEPSLDWGAARGSQFQTTRSESGRRGGKSFFQSTTTATKDEELDWGNIRNRPSGDARPARDSGADLDWGSARGSQFGKKSNASGSAHLRKQIAEKENVDDKPKIQSSRFGVLSTESEDEDEESTEANKADEEPVTQLEKETQKLSVDNKDADDWNVVGKK